MLIKIEFNCFKQSKEIYVAKGGTGKRKENKKTKNKEADGRHILVFPAASNPSMSRRISLDPKILPIILDIWPPMVRSSLSVCCLDCSNDALKSNLSDRSILFLSFAMSDTCFVLLLFSLSSLSYRKCRFLASSLAFNSFPVKCTVERVRNVDKGANLVRDGG